MVKMLAGQQSEFPKLAKFIETDLPGIAGNARIWDAFLTFSELKEEDARETLAWKSGPRLQILNLHGANGSFDPDKPTQIVLAREIAKRFDERDSDLIEARLLVQATVLHELVHWGDARDGRVRTDHEIGNAFEIEAYGRNIDRYWVAEDPGAAEAGYLFPITGRIGSTGACWGPDVRSDGEHKGIDVFTSIGSPVFAVASGKVMTGNQFRKGEPFFSQDTNYGQMVDIRHDDRHLSRYAHLHEVLVKAGEAVTAGQLIAKSGASGTKHGAWVAQGQPAGGPPAGATRPHLHFEIHRPASDPFAFGSTLDPATFFDWLPNGTAAADAAVEAKRPGRPPLDTPSTGAPVPAGRCSAGAPPKSGGSKRGIRNNCPGNLRLSDDGWVGMCPNAMQNDTAFTQFSEMKWGIRAMARVLRRYKRRSPAVRTLEAMSSIWAPDGDGANDASQHAILTMQNSGGDIASINQVIDLDDERILFATIRGIIAAECGKAALAEVGDATIRNGIALERSIEPSF